jgi:flagellar M-ring protein FliF
MAQVVCDFDQEVTSSVTYSSPIEDSDTGMLRSQQISKINSQTTTNGTIVGADSNQGAGALNGTGTASSENSQSINSEYELNQVNKDIVKALGNIDPERSSITVNLLYGNKFAESPISTDEARDTVIKMVASATGINQNRITVTSFKLAVSEDAGGISGYSILVLLENSAPYIAAVIIIGIVMIFILRIKASFEDKELEDAALVGGNIDLVAGDEDGIQELDNTSELKQQINSFIDKQPDVAAGMLRNWIYENDK